MSLQVEPAELAGRLARDAHGRPLGEVETVFADEDGSGSRYVGIDTEEGAWSCRSTAPRSTPPSTHSTCPT